MPLSFEDYDHAPTCSLAHWVLGDRDILIRTLAWLYVRKPSHAGKILSDLAPGPAHFPGREFEQAAALLSYEIDDITDDLASADASVQKSARTKLDKRIEQRDGLLFQHLSWIAAHIRFPSARISPPHVRKADKGFDGVLIQVGTDDAALSKVILCEDKATINPRNLVTSSIWPEVEKVEQGAKDLEILDAVTALLDKTEGVDTEKALSQITWENIRQYRVALTAPSSQAQDGHFRHLFAGFDVVAPRDIQGRIAEVIPLDDVRGFLDQLAADVRTDLVALRALTHV